MKKFMGIGMLLTIASIQSFAMKPTQCVVSKQSVASSNFYDQVLANQTNLQLTEGQTLSVYENAGYKVFIREADGRFQITALSLSEQSSEVGTESSTLKVLALASQKIVASKVDLSVIDPVTDILIFCKSE